MTTVYYPRYILPAAGAFAWGSLAFSNAYRQGHPNDPIVPAELDVTITLAASHHMIDALGATYTNDVDAGCSRWTAATGIPGGGVFVGLSVRADAAPGVELALIQFGAYLEPDWGGVAAPAPVFPPIS